MRARSVDHLERPDSNACDSSRGVLLPQPKPNDGRPRSAGGPAAPARKIVLKEGDLFLNGRYRFERRLGAGGMSQVWAAIELYSENFVAIKLLHDQGGNLALRFRQECRFYPKLKHANIVRMSAAGEDENGSMYIVMDLLEGSTLRRVLRSGRLNIEGALHLAVQLADACAYMHRQGIWHRDLKPENVMVGSKGEMKGHLWLFDFGISKFANPQDAGLDTDELPDVATVRYMATEQVDGARRRFVDGRADIYAFGVILYELITGRHIFIKEGEPTTAAQIMNGHLVAEVKPIPHIVNDCPEELWQLVKKCLAKDPADRHQTFDEIGAELSDMIRASHPPDHYIAKRVKQTRMRAARARVFADSAIGDEERGVPDGEDSVDEALDSVHRRPTAPGVYPAAAHEAALRTAANRDAEKSRRAAGAPSPEEHPGSDEADELGVETPRFVRATEPMPPSYHPPTRALPFVSSSAPWGGAGARTDKLPSVAAQQTPAVLQVRAVPAPIAYGQDAQSAGSARSMGASQGLSSVERSHARVIPVAPHAPASSDHPEPEIHDVPSRQTARSVSTSMLISTPSADSVNAYAPTEPLQKPVVDPPSSLTPILTMNMRSSPSSPLPSAAALPALPRSKSRAYMPAVAVGLMISVLGAGAVLATRGHTTAAPTTVATTSPTTIPTTSPAATLEPDRATDVSAPPATVAPSVAAPTAAPVIAASALPASTSDPVAVTTSPPRAPAPPPAASAKPAARPVKPAPQPSSPSPFHLPFDFPDAKKGKSGLLDLEDNAQPRHATSSRSVRHA